MSSAAPSGYCPKIAALQEVLQRSSQENIPSQYPTIQPVSPELFRAHYQDFVQQQGFQVSGETSDDISQIRDHGVRTCPSTWALAHSLIAPSLQSQTLQTLETSQVASSPIPTFQHLQISQSRSSVSLLVEDENPSMGTGGVPSETSGPLTFEITSSNPATTEAPAHPVPGLQLVVEGGQVLQSDTVMEVVEKSTPVGWESVFRGAINELRELSQVLSRVEREQAAQWFPLRQDLFNAFHLTPLNAVRVVIMGQDPYHNVTSRGIQRPQAMGLSFSVPYGVDPPPSLLNIYKEIKSCYPDFQIPSHGNLTAWARQGVLLLNACLTVQPHQPDSHAEVWDPFIVQVLRAIVNTNPKVIFVLWGKKAKRIAQHVGNSIILEAAHPSPYSARGGFFGCRHFRLINDHLQRLGQPPINWALPEEPVD